MGRVALVFLAVLLVAGCSSGDAFTFAEDDLCEWVTEADVTSYVTEAFAESDMEWDARAVAVEPHGSTWDLPNDYCRWDLTGSGYVIARGLTPSAFSPVLSWSEAFGDGIIAGGAAYGRHGFWLEGSDEALGLEVAFPEGSGLSGGSGLPPGSGRLSSSEDLFVVANGFLEEMRWAP
jgi:hypothetical protein